jgi:hypothetical protein
MKIIISVARRGLLFCWTAHSLLYLYIVENVR